MKLFDLHCDTAGECFTGKKRLLSNDLHIDLCKGKCLDKWIQTFAVWIPDSLRGDESRKYFDDVLGRFKSEMKANADKIELCQHFSDLKRITESGKCAAVLACEGASPFAYDGGIKDAKQIGVKLITLTWDGENEVGFGCQSGSEAGLKPLGKRLLSEMKENKIAADASHLNGAGFYDAIDSGAAVLASHSTAKSVLMKTRADSTDKDFSCRRALDDEQIRLLIKSGGLIGLNFYRSYLGDSGDDGFEAVYRHLYHMLELGAENSLAIGSDFDGCDISGELAGVDKIPDLYLYLSQKGLNDALLGKIFFDNAVNFFENLA